MASLPESVLPIASPTAAELARVGTMAAQVPTPALIYDLDRLTHQVALLQSDLAAIPHLQLCFAVKANRNPDVLRHLAGLGIGADVASLAELAAAHDAGMDPIVATSPGWGGHQSVTLAAAGITPDCDSVSQVVAWGAETLLPRRIGLRLRRPLTGPNEHRSESRFGVSLDSPALWQAIERYGLTVAHLHVHTDAWLDDTAVETLLDTLTAALQRLPEIESINLGGGIAGLYGNPRRARRVWRQVAEAVTDWEVWRDRPLRVVLEPGLAIAGAAGYLVTTVLAADDEPDGTRLATLDASRWNLFPWEGPLPVLQLPQGMGPAQRHDLAGITCNEADLLAHQVALNPVQVGDRVIFAGAGAYTSSMYRTAHGIPAPDEWILQGQAWRRSDTSEFQP